MILKRELIVNLKSLILWAIVLGGLNLLTLSLFPEAAKQQQSLNEMLKSYPEALIKAFDLDRLGFGNVLEYYATKGYTFTALFGSIYSVMLGSNILSKEENEKTIEFLLSKPITRKNIVTQKLISVLMLILILNIIITGINYIGAKIGSGDGFDIGIFLLLSLATLLLHMIFGALAFSISTKAKRTRGVLSLSLGLVFITYFLQILSKTSLKYENLKYLSPFEYANAVDVVTQGQIRPLYMFVMCIVAVISILIAYLVYTRKDILI